MLKWRSLTDIAQLEEIQRTSMTNPVMIFKHSTRCSISHTSLERLKRNGTVSESGEIPIFLLDLIRDREISNQISESYSVDHQSPQVLLIHEGEVVYHESHFGIRFESIRNEIERIKQAKN
ncbi:MAG: bacillithiol system redox-active protein YtxJ [Flammeovirgaceae bacterium]|nr:bacillithiol system redox-active protein YtxJ [Flammeovirgaceae bacterium]